MFVEQNDKKNTIIFWFRTVQNHEKIYLRVQFSIKMTRTTRFYIQI